MKHEIVMLENLSASGDSDGDDLVYLNIKEKQCGGKMQSYFKWVHTLDNIII